MSTLIARDGAGRYREEAPLTAGCEPGFHVEVPKRRTMPTEVPLHGGESMRSFLYCLISMALLASCKSSEFNECAPGKTENCPCVDGTQGVQTCFDDGSGWSDCECPCVEDCGELECGPGPVCGDSCGDCTDECTGQVDNSLCIDGVLRQRVLSGLRRKGMRPGSELRGVLR